MSTQQAQHLRSADVRSREQMPKRTRRLRLVPLRTTTRRSACQRANSSRLDAQSAEWAEDGRGVQEGAVDSDDCMAGSSMARLRAAADMLESRRTHDDGRYDQQWEVRPEQQTRSDGDDQQQPHQQSHTVMVEQRADSLTNEPSSSSKGQPSSVTTTSRPRGIVTNRPQNEHTRRQPPAILVQKKVRLNRSAENGASTSVVNAGEAEESSSVEQFSDDILRLATASGVFGKRTPKRRLTDDQLPFHCNWADCDKRFANRKYLSQHARRHADENAYDAFRYACSFDACLQRFTSRYNLARHRRYHFMNRVPPLIQPRIRTIKSTNSPAEGESETLFRMGPPLQTQSVTAVVEQQRLAPKSSKMSYQNHPDVWRRSGDASWPSARDEHHQQTSNTEDMEGVANESHITDPAVEHEYEEEEDVYVDDEVAPSPPSLTSPPTRRQRTSVGVRLGLAHKDRAGVVNGVKQQHPSSSALPTDGGRTHQCQAPGCGKWFANRKYVQRHAKCHQGDEYARQHPHRCTFGACTMRFTSRFSLARHRRAHFMQTAFVCDDEHCGARFERSEELAAHTQRVHDVASQSAVTGKAVVWSTLNGGQAAGLLGTDDASPMPPPSAAVTTQRRHKVQTRPRQPPSSAPLVPSSATSSATAHVCGWPSCPDAFPLRTLAAAHRRTHYANP